MDIESLEPTEEDQLTEEEQRKRGLEIALMLGLKKDKDYNTGDVITDRYKLPSTTGGKTALGIYRIVGRYY